MSDYSLKIGTEEALDADKLSNSLISHDLARAQPLGHPSNLRVNNAGHCVH